jgi:hypothetical protein
MIRVIGGFGEIAAAAAARRCLTATFGLSNINDRMFLSEAFVAPCE